MTSTTMSSNPLNRSASLFPSLSVGPNVTAFESLRNSISGFPAPPPSPPTITGLLGICVHRISG